MEVHKKLTKSKCAMEDSVK